MVNVTIYKADYCPYCRRAMALLDKKSIENLTVIDVMDEPEKREEMRSLAGRNSIPQIFINDEHIGGCDDLMALEKSGKLNEKLGLSPIDND